MVELATLPADRPLEEIEMSRDDFISLFPSLCRELVSGLNLAARPSRTMAAQEKAEAIRSTLSYWAEDPDVLAVVPFILGKLHQIDPEVTVEGFARFLVGDALIFVELEMGQADPGTATRPSASPRRASSPLRWTAISCPSGGTTPSSPPSSAGPMRPIGTPLNPTRGISNRIAGTAAGRVYFEDSIPCFRPRYRLIYEAE